jgi:hypothetical protein
LLQEYLQTHISFNEYSYNIATLQSKNFFAFAHDIINY